MAVGNHRVLGPPVMRALARLIRGCPPPWVLADAGYFVQEWGEAEARAALDALAE